MSFCSTFLTPAGRGARRRATEERLLRDRLSPQVWLILPGTPRCYTPEGLVRCRRILGATSSSFLANTFVVHAEPASRVF